MPYDHSLALSLGDACLACRSDKKRCDGAKPICGRCLRLSKECVFSHGIHRRKRTDILEDRIDALQSKIAEMSSSHTRSLLSAQLFEKMALLTNRRHTNGTACSVKMPRRSEWVPLFPLTDQPYPYVHELARGAVLSEEPADASEEGYRPVVPRSKIENMFAKWDVAQEVTPDMAVHLVGIFLPFRSHFQFYMDPSRLVRALSLPSDDPRAIHPSLLNAIYLSACNIAGGVLCQYEPIFLSRTRHHLSEQLAYADRILDFLWANMVLGSYFGRLARLVEAYTTITSCARFAIACGLPGTEHSPESPVMPLLPPPISQEELEERTQLCHAIYMTDRCFAICTGWPRAFITIQDTSVSTLASRFEAVELDDSPAASPASSDSHTMTASSSSSTAGTEKTETTLVEAEVSQPPLGFSGNIKVSSMIIFERVELFAKRVHDSGGIAGESREEWRELNSRMLALFPHLPPITDPSGIKPFEVIAKTNPHLIPAHVYMYGGSLILNSLMCHEDPAAQRNMIAAAMKLTNLGKQMRGTTGLSTIQTYVESIGHMLNAARIFAKELQRADTRRDIQRLAECCAALADLIDFLHDLTDVHPAWAHVLQSMRDMLPDTPEALERLPEL